MKKYLLSLILLSGFSIASFGQDVKQKTDPLKSDPRTAERAAQADVRLIDKKSVTDTAYSKPVATKEKGCRHKRKKKSGIRN